jgi:hypothetical protein
MFRLLFLVSQLIASCSAAQTFGYIFGSGRLVHDLALAWISYPLRHQLDAYKRFCKSDHLQNWFKYHGAKPNPNDRVRNGLQLTTNSLGTAARHSESRVLCWFHIAEELTQRDEFRHGHAWQLEHWLLTDKKVQRESRHYIFSLARAIQLQPNWRPSKRVQRAALRLRQIAGKNPLEIKNTRCAFKASRGLRSSRKTNKRKVHPMPAGR